MLSTLIVLAAAIFLTGYIVYGRYIGKLFELNDAQITPAHEYKDGVDYVPSKTLVLLGHHFSSIAGAGPIIGPVIAGLYFGWLPALLWIVLGTIFIGGVHDFSAVVASIRHQGKSLPEVCKKYMNMTAYRLFLAFIWLALVYIIIVFADLTAGTFSKDGGVATASCFYIFLALLFGYAVNKMGVPLWLGTTIAVIFLIGAIFVGQQFPLSCVFLEGYIGLDNKQIWYLLLILYCFIASITPVWILLQPRDYLSSYLLYFSLVGATLGLLLGNFSISYPHFMTWNSKIGPLFPLLFITVACGACSGFHSLVASGTTSKQLFRETDSRRIGYGAMLIEGFLAVVSLGTVMILAQNSPLISSDPMEIYATGIGRFFSSIKIPTHLGQTFGYLAIATFVLTTLDTATRLGRYILEEFCGMKNSAMNRSLATFLTLLFPIVFCFLTISDPSGAKVPAWKAIWPVFGATNQLLAGLALLSVVVWLKVTKKRYSFVLLPAIFMMVTTLVALFMLTFSKKSLLITGISAALGLLALILIGQAVKIFWPSFLSTITDRGKSKIL